MARVDRRDIILSTTLSLKNNYIEFFFIFKFSQEKIFKITYNNIIY